MAVMMRRILKKRNLKIHSKVRFIRPKNVTKITVRHSENSLLGKIYKA